ncbi:MAG: septum formation protein Maf [Bacteroidetes bacterium GWA2_30_7]|nr:MAG: septum formation protein Maf [Bacteroidetes bacterium GWA2_30_7]
MLLEKLSNFNLILASKSPRRQFLMKEAGFKFSVEVKEEICEDFPKNLKKEEIALFLAEHKSVSFGEIKSENTIVITADTIVWLNNEVINKPESRTEAISMLEKLSENIHYVYSGVCLRSRQKQKSFYVCSSVKFKQLTSDEISYYVDNFKPYDKAGAYGIQEWLGYIGIEEINGCFYNVMGLPVQRLYVELEKFI